MNSSFLFDKDFLAQLDQEHNKEIYAKIITLTMDESPIEEISGKVLDGNINVDGGSNVRRTCSLTMVAQDVDLTNFTWGLNTKFKLFIGVKNSLNTEEYDNIIWFKQGIFLFTDFSTSLSSNSFQISLSGVDKMCLLNGTIGGKIPSLSWVFDQVEIMDAMGGISNEKYALQDIIRDAVHLFGQESYANIVINDLDIEGLELLEYRGDDDLYIFFRAGSDAEPCNIAFGGNIKETFYDDFNVEVNIENPLVCAYDLRTDLFGDANVKPTYVHKKNGTERYTIGRVTYGQLAGYKLHALVYPDDLIGNIGEDIASAVLDPICNMLGDFEYFYDLDGRFVFQKKNNYMHEVFSNVQFNLADNTFAVESGAHSSALSYHFDNNTLISSISNNPDLSNIKNDFSIWGTRSGANGNEIPVHLRYAIDEKPLYYKNFDGKVYISEEFKQMLQAGQNTFSDGPVFTGFETQSEFQKYSLPGFLNADWWELEDFGEYYNYLTGEYPRNDLTIDKFWSAYTYLDLEKFSQSYLKGMAAGITWDPFRYIYIFSINAKTKQVINVNLNPPLGANGTTPFTSSTTYQELMNRKKNNNEVTFIFLPQLPRANMSTAVMEKLDRSRMECWDWREIIYQMALDYYAHNHEIDFHVQLEKNNPGVYPKGITGYEQYYVDIMSFWRELYDPSIVAFEMGNGSANTEYSTIYAWNPATQSFKMLPFEDYTEIQKITADTPTVYYFEDNEYKPYYYNINYGTTCYRSEKITLLENLKASTHYYLKNGDTYEYQKDIGVNGFTPGKIYYIKKGYEQAMSFSIPAKNTNYYIKGKDGKYSKAFTIYANTNYYKDAQFKSIANYFSKGKTFYSKEHGSFTLISGTVYYINKGYEEVLNLSKFSTNDYFNYSNMKADFNLDYTPSGKKGLLLKPGITYYRRYAIEAKNFKNNDYFVITSTKPNNFVVMEQRKFLKEFVSGENYYIKDSTHRKCEYPYSQYNPKKENIYEVRDYNFYKTTDTELRESKTYYTEKVTWHPYNYYLVKNDYVGQPVYNSQDYNPGTGWTLYLEAPDKLNFWFDFLDSKASEIGKYSVKNIGQRPYFINDDSVKAIYNREAPRILYVLNPNESYVQPAYTPVQLSGYYLSIFATSSQKTNAMEVLQDCLYRYTYGNEQISLTTIPIYYLEPNTRISIIDKNSNINGEYIIQSFSLSLGNGNSMNISAYRAADTIF